jgi:hypothetical protein
MATQGRRQYCIFTPVPMGGEGNPKYAHLDTENCTITNQKDIIGHVVEFYKDLFGSSPHTGVHLFPGFYTLKEKL